MCRQRGHSHLVRRDNRKTERIDGNPYAVHLAIPIFSVLVDVAVLGEDFLLAILNDVGGVGEV